MKFRMRVDGITPLLQASAISMLLPKVGATMKSVEDIESPTEQAALLVYTDTEGNFGHPTVAFKSAFISASVNFKWPGAGGGKRSVGKILAGALEIEPYELVVLTDEKGTPLTDYEVDIRIIRNQSTKGRRPSAKPRWNDWHCFLNIDLDNKVWPDTEEGEELFFAICEYAGRAIGIGAGRPENRKLSFGKFTVTKV